MNLREFKRSSIYSKFNELMRQISTVDELRTLYPAQGKFLEMVKQFCDHYTRKLQPNERKHLTGVYFEDLTTNLSKDDAKSTKSTKEKASTPELKPPKTDDELLKTGSIYDKRKIDLNNFIKQSGTLGISDYVNKFAKVCDEVSHEDYKNLTFENAVKKYYNEHLAQIKESTANTYIAAINYYFKNVINRPESCFKLRSIGSQSRPMLAPEKCSEQMLDEFCERFNYKNHVIGDIV